MLAHQFERVSERVDSQCGDSAFGERKGEQCSPQVVKCGRVGCCGMSVDVIRSCITEELTNAKFDVLNKNRVVDINDSLRRTDNVESSF